MNTLVSTLSLSLPFIFHCNIWLTCQVCVHTILFLFHMCLHVFSERACLVILYLSLFLAATSTRLWCGPPTLCSLHLQPITWQGNAPISLCSASCDCACHFSLLLSSIETSRCLAVIPWETYPFFQSSVGITPFLCRCCFDTWVTIQYTWYLLLQ